MYMYNSVDEAQKEHDQWLSDYLWGMGDGGHLQ